MATALKIGGGVDRRLFGHSICVAISGFYSSDTLAKKFERTSIEAILWRASIQSIALEVAFPLLLSMWKGGRGGFTPLKFEFDKP